MYASLAESPTRDVTLLIRAARETDGLVPAVRRVVTDVDPTVPVRSVMWMEDVVRAAYSTAWVVMGLLVALAVFATALGALGVYAALTQRVAAGRREIGVRLALGAEPAKVVGSVVVSGLSIAGVGILVGTLAAALSARVLESMLFGVSALAPLAYVTPAVALGIASLLAGWVPAWRAGTLPPAEVLRGD
jgi:ABC-type antimicrobial peptide transport system permease subunit